MDLLRREGLLVRRRGVGTTVVMPKYEHGLDRLEGLAETLTGYGAVTNEVRSAEMVTVVPTAVAERLEIPPARERSASNGCVGSTDRRSRWTPAT